MAALEALIHLDRIRPDPRWRMPAHQHAHHETIVLLSGVLHVVLAGREIRAAQGDVLHYRAGVAHDERSDGEEPCELYYLAWSGDDEGLPLQVADRTGRMRTLLAWCEHDTGFEVAPETDLRRRYLELFFAEYAKAVHLAGTPQDFVHRVVNHITQHMAEALTLDDLAEIAGMSRSHFVRAYKAARGMTPMEDLRRHRVERARRLLVTTDLPIKAIPEQVGLANEYHMSRLFRRVYGVTPGAVRKRRDDGRD